MVQSYTSYQLSKSRAISTSNWAAKLTDAQIRYAALDAVASLLIFEGMRDQRPESVIS